MGLGGRAAPSAAHDHGRRAGNEKQRASHGSGASEEIRNAQSGVGRARLAGVVPFGHEVQRDPVRRGLGMCALKRRADSETAVNDCEPNFLVAVQIPGTKGTPEGRLRVIDDVLHRFLKADAQVLFGVVVEIRLVSSDEFDHVVDFVESRLGERPTGNGLVLRVFAFRRKAFRKLGGQSREGAECLQRGRALGQIDFESGSRCAAPSREREQ